MEIDMIHPQSQFIVNENGEKTAVILPIEEYERLLEDINDIAVIAERRNEPGEPLEAVKERLERKWRNTIV